MRKNVIRTAAAALAGAVLLTGNVLAADLSIFDGLPSENDEIAAIQGYAYSEDVVALDDLGISVSATGYAAIRQKDGFVYIYTQTDGSMPYVIVGRYDTQTEDFADAFTAYMKNTYGEDALLVTEPAAVYNVNGIDFTRIAYQYPVGEYTVKDTRLFFGWNGATYMFGAKEVPMIGFEVPAGCLEQVAGSMAPLAGGDSDYMNHVDSTRYVTGDVFSLDNVEIEPDNTDNTEGGSVGSPVEGIPADSGEPSDTGSGGRIVFDESKVSYAGTWVPFEDGFKLYLPNDWSYYNLTQEQIDGGIIYLAGDASGSADAPFLEVSYMAAGNLETPRQLADELRNAGLRVDDVLLVNDIMCVNYAAPDQDIAGLMFFDPYYGDYIFNIAGTPFSKCTDTLGFALCSLSLG